MQSNDNTTTLGLLNGRQPIRIPEDLSTLSNINSIMNENSHINNETQDNVIRNPFFNPFMTLANTHTATNDNVYIPSFDNSFTRHRRYRQGSSETYNLSNIYTHGISNSGRRRVSRSRFLNSAPDDPFVLYYHTNDAHNNAFHEDLISEESFPMVPISVGDEIRDDRIRFHRKSFIDIYGHMIKTALNKLMDENLLIYSSTHCSTHQDLVTSYFFIDKMDMTRVNDFIKCLPSIKTILKFTYDRDFNAKNNYYNVFFSKLCLDIYEYHLKKYEQPHFMVKSF